MEGLRFIAICCLYVVVQGSQDYEITYPERLDYHRLKRDLLTTTDDGHEKSASFALKAFKKNWIFDAKQNDQLIPKSFVLRTFDSDDSEVVSTETPEACHYQGSIRGIPGSLVVLHTCNGLRGLVDDGKQSYQIEPRHDYQVTGAHIITKETPEFDSDNHCGTHDQDESLDADSATPDQSRLASTLKRLRRGIGHVVDTADIYKPYLTTKETKYNELLLVVDNGVYKKLHNNSKTVTDKVLLMCNAVDAIYQRINIRIVATAIEIWTNGDRMARYAGKGNGGKELKSFKEYRMANLVNKIHHDNAQFLSGHSWGAVIGMAYLGTICSKTISCGINSFNTKKLVGSLITVAHEMGHNFGFGHNSASKNCTCLTPNGCFMYGGKMFSTWKPGVSDCNLRSMAKKNHKCLFNVPKKVLDPRCGNGIRENDEECDCGTPEMCKLKDPCCQPHHCRLKPSSQCSDLHHTCCQSCQFKKHGTLCRSINSDCDVPEYCTGDSGDCPVDAVMRDGTPCNRTNKLLIGNVNKKDIVSRALSPRVEARYVRINPQYWNNKICMRTEILGCSSDEVNPTMPTALKFLRSSKYCISSSSGSCSSDVNTNVVLKSGLECEQRYMEFKLDANGILWHDCSNRRVCPANGKNKDGVILVISSSCTDDNSKFVRTSMNTLKHVKTGRCVEPKRQRIRNNLVLVLRSKCGEKISFVKPDCMIPLGISSKTIPDEHMTSSSSWGSNLPHQGRLDGTLGWCPDKNRKTEYLQIDLGKTKTISHILTQGHKKSNYWVSGYYLLYSNDGNRWTGYTESGDDLHSNSYCYSGKCAETINTQCRDLWGADSKNAVKGCYDELNTQDKGYGTCDPVSISPCAAKDVLCGQIQCYSKKDKPKVDYGQSYKKITLDDSSQCSAAVLKSSSDMLGRGMVEDGTKCGDKKMCSDNKCMSFGELDIKPCPIVNGKECNGQGVCTSTGKCQCYEMYDPDTGCQKALPVQDGGYSDWSDWSDCTAGCNGGKQTRHRFCTNPRPLNGGKDCVGQQQQEQDCNNDACPKVHSCRHLQSIGSSTNKVYPDGIYTIHPQGLSNTPIKTYCDMSRDGGGWTLLVTSATNTWTAHDITLRNADKPSLTDDYSILKYADDIKNKVSTKTFEYRLEADSPGRWGGVWDADSSYTFTSNNNKQTNVRLIKKFDKWSYSTSKGIGQRMPWISGATLTTSDRRRRKTWGTIAGDSVDNNPAAWMGGVGEMEKPEFIWYWMREGPSNIVQYGP